MRVAPSPGTLLQWDTHLPPPHEGTNVGCVLSG